MVVDPLNASVFYKAINGGLNPLDHLEPESSIRRTAVTSVLESLQVIRVKDHLNQRVKPIMEK